MPSLRNLLGVVLPLVCTGVDAAGPVQRGGHGGHGGQYNAKLSQGHTNGTQHKDCSRELNMSVALARACFDLYHLAGGSNLGTFNAPTYPAFRDGPHPGGSYYPWGNRNASNTNPYNVNNVPNTGVTRRYAWTITNTTLAPDGVELPLLVANGQFPGETIEANWGDWIEVEVTNGLTVEGTSLHWHGFLQTGTPYMDGSYRSAGRSGT